MPEAARPRCRRKEVAAAKSEKLRNGSVYSADGYFVGFAGAGRVANAWSVGERSNAPLRNRQLFGGG